MRFRYAVSALALALFFLGGCFQTHTVIFLNEDGSGTIEETVMLASYAINMVAELDSTQAFSLIDEEKLMARADSMGEGVTFEGAEEVSEDGYVGYVAVYSFEDINTIRLLDNSEALQLGDEEEEEVEDEDGSDMGFSGLAHVTFSYSPGELQIHVPREDGEEMEIHPDTLAAKVEEIRAQFEQSGGLMRAFLADAHMSARVELPSDVTETNASYVDGPTMTLADIIFGSLIDLMENDPELSARLQLAQSESQRQALLAEVGELDGFVFEPLSEVYLRFE